ncbi:hypothetical protein [Sodalis sp.]|uniref:hypothetical protein n=1 Tax=Sodalis sp. (in: enterobacteria) TaxID=1898979 RepID=UPI0038739995
MSVGSLKLLFHRKTKQILGIHCFGKRAAEIIHIGQAIMEQEGKAIPSSIASIRLSITPL